MDIPADVIPLTGWERGPKDHEAELAKRDRRAAKAPGEAPNRPSQEVFDDLAGGL